MWCGRHFAAADADAADASLVSDTASLAALSTCDGVGRVSPLYWDL